MSTENINLPLIEGIYDIQPISAPPLSLIETSMFAIAVFLFFSTIIYLVWKYLYSNNAIAKRKIIKLKKNHLEQKISSHLAIYQLCEIITQGLQLNSIGEKTPISNEILYEQEKWLGFTKELSLLRYSQNKINTDKLHTIFEQSLHWLKIWP